MARNSVESRSESFFILTELASRFTGVPKTGLSLLCTMIRLYRKLLEELEELECIRAFDSAKASHDEIIPFEQAVEEIERNC